MKSAKKEAGTRYALAMVLVSFRKLKTSRAASGVRECWEVENRGVDTKGGKAVISIKFQVTITGVVALCYHFITH